MSSTTKQVSFSDITIREHGMELGDHPSCSQGAPVQLSWECQDVSTRDIEFYEYMKESEGRGRRHGRKQLLIPVRDRAMILLRAGYTIDEIGDAACEVDKIKKQRSETLKQSPRFDGFRVLMETVVPKPVRNTVQARTA